jgi:hypothetical protein
VCVHIHFLRYTRETCHTPAVSSDSTVCCVGGGAQGGRELVCVHTHFLRNTRETCHTPAVNTRSCERDRAYRPDRVKVEGRQNEQLSEGAGLHGPAGHNTTSFVWELGQQEWNLRAMRCKEWCCADTPAASLSSMPWLLENHWEAPQLSEGVFSLRFPRADPPPHRGRLHTNGAPIQKKHSACKSVWWVRECVRPFGGVITQ